MDGVHDADDVVFGGDFFLQDVAVSEKGDCVLVHLDDPMDEVVAVYVTHQGNCSHLDVFFFPRAECELVAEVDHEGVHAVAFDCQGYGLSFGDQCADLLHHYRFVYGYCL